MISYSIIYYSVDGETEPTNNHLLLFVVDDILLCPEPLTQQNYIIPCGRTTNAARDRTPPVRVVHCVAVDVACIVMMRLLFPHYVLVVFLFGDLPMLFHLRHSSAPFGRHATVMLLLLRRTGRDADNLVTLCSGIYWSY